MINRSISDLIMLFGMRWPLTLGVFLGISLITVAQNLEKIGTKKPLKISGGISANQVLYASNQKLSGRLPYTWVLTGNINFNLYEWNVPLSYTLSNQGRSFQQPFNQYSMHPTYKWVTGHIGYTSMSFSPYTISGYTFLGAGVDLAPKGVFKMSAFYGRMQRSVAYDTANRSVLPSFRRMGYGIKTGLSSKNYGVEIIVFKAADVANSLSPLPSDTLLNPQENLVLSAIGRISPMKGLTVSSEIAGSALSTNIFAEQSAKSGSTLYETTKLFKSRTSSTFYKAYKANIAYGIKNSSIGAGYERIDPGYKTLGAYYSNNDYENITANFSTSLFKNKVPLSCNIGVQHDNLDNSKSSKTNRFVGSVNTGFNPNKKLNIAASYSSFQTYTNITSQFEKINQISPFENFDTLDYIQLSQTASLNIGYVLGQSDKKRQNISLNSSIQVASDNQASQNSGSTFLNNNISYSYNYTPSNITVSSSFNTNNSFGLQVNTFTLGPTITLSKSLLKKTLRSTVSASENSAFAAGKNTNTIVTGRVSNTYTLKKKHNFSLSFVVSMRSGNTANTRSKIAEYTGTLGYSYNF